MRYRISERIGKKRRYDLTEQGHRYKPQDRMMFKVVVADGIDKHELFDAFGCIERQSSGNGATVRTAREHRPADAEPIHKPRDHPRLRLDRIVKSTRLFRVSKSDQIDRNHP